MLLLALLDQVGVEPVGRLAEEVDEVFSRPVSALSVERHPDVVHGTLGHPPFVSQGGSLNLRL